MPIKKKKYQSKTASETRRKVSSSTEAEKIALLKKQLKQRELELKIYREIGDATAKGTKLTVVLNKLLGFVLRALSTDSGTLYTVDDFNAEFVFEVVKGPGSEKLKGKRFPLKSGIAGYVATSGKSFISKDLSKEKRWLGQKSKFSGRNMLAVPLKIKERVIGVIAVLNKEGKCHFTDDDLIVLESLAKNFSIVMERNELCDTLKRGASQSKALHGVAALLASTLDEKVIRERAMTSITGLIRAEAGSLLMVDKKKKELFFEVALGLSSDKVKEVRLKIGEGIAGWVARYGKTLVVNDVKKDKRFLRRVDKRSKFITRNVLCVPVRVKGKTIGVLQAVNKVSGNFTDEDAELFELFSNQVAIALDNARLYNEIRETFYSTSHALADAIEKRDPYTGGHTKRVLAYSVTIGERMGMKHEDLENLKLSAVLHDVGKIGVDDSILRKPGRLDKKEAQKMMQHPRLGAEILRFIPQLKEVMPGIIYHHERLDGKGYPTGLKGRKIPLMAKIIAVADTYDAMTSTRPYRKGLDAKIAIDELKRCSGTQFDARVVKAFVASYENGDFSEYED